MTEAQGTTPNLSFPFPTLPSGPLLIEPEYLLSELLKEASRLAQPGSAHPSDAAVAALTSLKFGGGANVPYQQFARVPLNGVIREWSADYTIDYLRQAYADRDIAGVLLEVNTGGGAVAASERIRDAVASRNKPVVVHTHFMASGGLLATLDADEIIAGSESAIIGSIGVVQTVATYMRDYLNRYFTFVYADTSEQKNATSREFLRTGETSVYKPLLNNLDTIFMDAVTAARPLPAATRADTLKGGTWLAAEAQQRGLVDGIGGTNYALSRLAEAVHNYS